MKGHGGRSFELTDKYDVRLKFTTYANANRPRNKYMLSHRNAPTPTSHSLSLMSFPYTHFTIDLFNVLSLMLRVVRLIFWVPSVAPVPIPGF